MHREDIDPYSTAIVEDLLSSQQEWKNVNDIIRLTFKALTEVVKNQGECLHQLERSLQSRASKSELHSGLALKANIQDISRTIAEIASNLDTKISYEDSQTILKDYALKADMQYLLSNKLDVDEVKSIIDKQSGAEFKGEIQALSKKFEDLQHSTAKKFQQVPSMKDFSTLAQAVEMKANLQEMTEVLETKATKHQVQQAVNKKISKQDLDQILQNYASLEDLQPIIQSLDQKSSLDQIDKIASILEVKVDRQDFSVLINSLQGKADLHQLELLKEQLQEMKQQIEQKLHDLQIGEVKKEIENLAKVQHKKADANLLNQLQSELEVVAQRANKISGETYQDLQRLKNELMESKQFTAEQMQATLMRSQHLTEQVTQELLALSQGIKQTDEERTAELEDLQKQINKLQKRDQQFKWEQVVDQIEEAKQEPLRLQKQISSLNKEVNELRAKILSQNDEQIYSQLEQQIQRKVNEIKKSSATGNSDMKSVKSELSQLISKKLSHFEQLMAQLEANVKQRVLYQDFDELKNIIQKLCIDQDERAYQKDLQKHIQLTKYTLDLVQKDILMKANIQDMCTLLDSKANIPEINNALEIIHKELSSKVSSDDLSSYLKNQNSVYESLCQENIVARFQWRNGEIQNHLVPWDYEVINTLPDNFVWEKGKTSILIVAPGVYQICCGFFGKEKFAVTVIVNGETISVHEQKKRASDYSGVSVNEFIVLPNRARLQIGFNGTKGEGLISLKRL